MSTAMNWYDLKPTKKQQQEEMNDYLKKKSVFMYGTVDPL